MAVDMRVFIELLEDGERSIVSEWYVGRNSTLAAKLKEYIRPQSNVLAIQYLIQESPQDFASVATLTHSEFARVLSIYQYDYGERLPVWNAIYQSMMTFSPHARLIVAFDQ